MIEENRCTEYTKLVREAPIYVFGMTSSFGLVRLCGNFIALRVRDRAAVSRQYSPDPPCRGRCLK